MGLPSKALNSCEWASARSALKRMSWRLLTLAGPALRSPRVSYAFHSRIGWLLVDFSLAAGLSCDLTESVDLVGAVTAVALVIAIAESVDSSLAREEVQDWF